MSAYFRSKLGYNLLPTNGSSRRGHGQFLRTRSPIFWLSSLFALGVFLFLVKSAVLWNLSPAIGLTEDWREHPEPKFPPLYENIYEFERNLPQHNASLPFPEGATGRYFYSAQHAAGAGWNNAMQELIFLAHLAYASGRSFVFDPYTWNRDMNENFTLYNNKLIPSRIPLNAIIAGPAAGAPFDADNLSPRAVNREYFEAVCKSPRLLTGDDVPDAVWSGDGDFIMQHWVEKLNKTPDPGILLDGPHSQIFPYYIFGVKSLVDTWPWLSKSPILTQWRWSPLVETALHANNDLVMPAKSLLRRAPDIVTDGEYSDMYAPIPGLLAMHVRRGDYIGHCDHLAKWGSHWQGWNTFPEFIDKFEAPPGSGNGEIDATPAAREVYQARCLPNHEQIVARVAELRKTPEGQGLRSIFVMTNAKSQWASELKSKLMATGGWDKVVTSRDLRLTWEQKFVGQAIDMLIGQRAQMFIGNGWSSMTANTVMLRQSKKMNPRTNRFW